MGSGASVCFWALAVREVAAAMANAAAMILFFLICVMIRVCMFAKLIKKSRQNQFSDWFLPGLALYIRIMLCVAMHAAKDVVDTEVCHEDGEERQEHEYVERHGTSESGQRLGMQGGCIHHKRDKRPYLLGVPSPVFAPRDVCPDGSDEDADAECGGSRIEEKERKTLQGCHLAGGVAVYQLHGQGCYGIDERQGQ